MFRIAFLCLSLAATATSQIGVTFTAQSGSVDLLGGTQQTIAAGTNLAPGLSLVSNGTNGTAFLQVQPMVIATGGFGIAALASATSSTGTTVANATITGLVTLQNPVSSQVVLDLSGGGANLGGGGSLSIDIDNDGIVELSNPRSPQRIPLAIGPTPRTVAFTVTAGISFFSSGTGARTLDLRIVPGTCMHSVVAATCFSRGIGLGYRENIQGGIDVFVPSTSTTDNPNPHLIAVVGAQLLPTPLPLPSSSCLLYVDPLTYWFVPRNPRLGATIHFDVPPSVLPLIGFLTAVDYSPTTLALTTLDTLRVDCH